MPAEGRLERVASWLAIFFAVFFARVCLIAAFSTDVPFWDQWEAEGSQLIVPWTEGTLRFLSLFEAHNEHRVFFTRVLTLALFRLNEHQWDNEVSAVFNAAVWAGILAGLGLYLRARLRPLSGLLATLVLVAIGSSPCDWENSLVGFQGQFYLMAGMSLVVILLAASCDDDQTPVLVMATVGFAALFTVASGLFASATGLGVLVLKWRSGALSRAGLVRCAVPLIGSLVLGLLLTHRVTGHDVLRSQGPWEWLSSTTLALSWPFGERFPGLLIWTPVLLLTAVAGFNPGRLKSIDFALIGLGAWAALQAFAIAFARGHEMEGVASRYSSISAVGALVAVVAGLRLWELMQPLGPGSVRDLLVALLFAAVMAGLIQQGVDGLDGARERRHFYELEADNVRAYVREGKADALLDKPLLHIPFPRMEFLQQQLDNPIVRAALPPSVRIAIPLETPQLTGFAAGGAFHTTPSPGGLPFIGSHAPETGDFTVGEFTTAPIQSHFKHVLISTAGYLGREGLRLEYSPVGPEPKRHREVLPTAEPREHWVEEVLAVPRDGLILNGYDRSPSTWYAVTAPVEIGRLGAWVRQLFAISTPALWGSAVFLLSLLLARALRATSA